MDGKECYFVEVTMLAFWLTVGIVICGLKFPFDVVGGQNAGRYAMFAATEWGLTSNDPAVDTAINRIRTDANGRGLSHNLTNLPIELARFWIATYEPNRAPWQPNATPGIVKGMSALIVWPWILLLVWKLGRRACRFRLRLHDHSAQANDIQRVKS
jgi:hypothetical protein